MIFVDPLEFRMADTAKPDYIIDVKGCSWMLLLSVGKNSTKRILEIFVKETTGYNLFRFFYVIDFIFGTSFASENSKKFLKEVDVYSHSVELNWSLNKVSNGIPTTDIGYYNSYLEDSELRIEDDTAHNILFFGLHSKDYTNEDLVKLYNVGCIILGYILDEIEKVKLVKQVYN